MKDALGGVRCYDVIVCFDFCMHGKLKAVSGPTYLHAHVFEMSKVCIHL
jgi:hypothetical protein